jgi:hypothetical protein
MTDEATVLSLLGRTVVCTVQDDAFGIYFLLLAANSANVLSLSLSLTQTDMLPAHAHSKHYADVID